MQLIKSIFRLPLLSIALVLISYGVFGWLLALHSADWRIWIPTGGIAFATGWVLSVTWAIAAVVFIFSRGQLLLSIGLVVIWALMSIVARGELRGFISSKGWAMIFLAFLAAIGLGIGWFTDNLPVVRSFGEALLKMR
ncbi:MAG: hypothetical protein WCO45_11665 [Pseudanabaena sp. ELA607]|jgi:hypothetical protein